MNKSLILIIAYANNFMFFSGLIIIMTAFGYASLAAEIALVYSIVSIFNQIFSYNVKNIILIDHNKEFAFKVLNFRIILGILILIFFFLILKFFQLNFYSNKIILSIVIIIIQQTIIEIILFLNELKKNFKIFNYYNSFYILNIFFIFINLFFLNNRYFQQIFYFIIIINFLFLFFFIDVKEILKNKILNFFNSDLKLFELSSSFSIILSIFFWRVFIYVNYEKEISGILFSSFALGSFSGTLFSNVIGPSIIKKKKEINLFSKIYFIIIVFFSVSLLFLLYKNIFFKNLTYYQYFFLEAALYSILGSAIMLFAVKYRLYFFEYRKYRKYMYKLDIFNGLITSFVPFILSTLNKTFIIYSYLFSSLITLIISYYAYKLSFKRILNE
jgi:hypothetical protein